MDSKFEFLSSAATRLDEAGELGAGDKVIDATGRTRLRTIGFLLAGSGVGG
jgi:hypothetical protein